MPLARTRAFFATAILLLSLCTASALPDETLATLSFEQKLNTQISLGLAFRDESGNSVTLKDYLGRKPVILVLGYYECPMLCSLVLNGMVESLQDLKWTIGKDFDVLNVSIAPNEGPQLAAAKRRTYLKRYGRTGAEQGWHFLTGPQSSIAKLADEAGFQYAYDSSSKQFAHPSGLVILTPEGKISKYLFGVTYSPNALYDALKQASSNQVGSPIQKLILLCFHYNPLTGKYGATVMLIVRCVSAATVAGLIWFVCAMLRHDAKRHLIEAPVIPKNRHPPASASVPISPP